MNLHSPIAEKNRSIKGGISKPFLKTSLLPSPIWRGVYGTTLKCTRIKSNMLALSFLFVLTYCHTKTDLPQYLAGTDTIEIIFIDKAIKDTVLIQQKIFIKKITHQLTYREAHKITLKNVAEISFLRRNLRHTLLKGTLTTDYAFLYFTINNKRYTCAVGKEAQRLIEQTRRYPTLLRNQL